VVAVIALLALPATVTAGPAGAGKSDRAKDACDLLTRTEIRSAFGERVRKPTQSLPEVIRDQECTWRIGGSAQAPGNGEIRTSLFRGSVATNNFAGVRPHGRAIKGLGDGAVYVFEPSLCCAVQVLQGKTFIGVQGVFPADPDLARDPAFEARLRRLAKRALTRL
jgi:hypothetical protein